MLWGDGSEMFVSHYAFLCLVPFSASCLSHIPHESLPNTRQPTISSLSGTVTASLQGAESLTAESGMPLRSGDTIETRAGAQVVLTLSDGSTLEIGEDTRLAIANLALQPQTQARTSRLKLLWGRIRASIAPDHQIEGSSFTVETPNALVGVKFSQPVIEVSYDPATKTSLFKAYTVALMLTNRSTKEIRQVPQGSQAVVHEQTIRITPLSSPVPPSSKDASQKPSEDPEETNPPASPPPARGTMMHQGRGVVRGATSSSAPISVGVVGTGETQGTEGADGTTTTETSSNPSPGTRPETPPRPRPVTVTIEEE